MTRSEERAASAYQVDHGGFLRNFNHWDEDFARGAAPGCRIEALTEDHWQVINYIRGFYREVGHTPLVYQTCRANDLRLRDLERLFPSGYLRGACLLAGIPTHAAYPPFALLSQYREFKPGVAEEGAVPEAEYVIDGMGFLKNPSTWDRGFAELKAFEMKLPGGMTDERWRVIDFLRGEHGKAGLLPTVIQTCDALGLELEDLERLFPDGYNRGAVKMAGLRPGGR